MTENVTKKVKGFLLKPSETFRATQAESLNSAFQYYVILAIIMSVLLFIVIAASVGIAMYTSPVTAALGSAGIGAVGAFIKFLETYVLFLPYVVFMLLLFGIFLSGFDYHIFVLLFGGKKGLVQTMKTVMYASTPALLLGWIPFVSIIGTIWSVILIIIGIRENQEI